MTYYSTAHSVAAIVPTIGILKLIFTAVAVTSVAANIYLKSAGNLPPPFVSP